MRERNITRTITTTIYEVSVMDNGQPKTEKFPFTGNITDAQALKVIRRFHENENYMIGFIVGKTEETELWEMSELDFMKFGHKVEK